MEICVLRHGIAQPGGEGLPDAARALTKEGREKLALVLARARAAGVVPSLVLTSPFVRAVETAAVAADALNCPQAVETEALTPSSSPQFIWEEIRRHEDEQSILLVGHEPLLGEAISFLVGAPRVIVDLKKGAMACINMPEVTRRPAGALVWLLTPKVCR
jgi:phosphohistidine phosphatase